MDGSRERLGDPEQTPGHAGLEPGRVRPGADEAVSRAMLDRRRTKTD
jgi:hypothetical protein